MRVNWNSGLPSYNSPWYPGQAIWCIGWRVLLLGITLTLPHIIIQRTAEEDGRSELQKRIHSLIKLRNLWNPDEDDDTVINQSFAQGLEALGWDRTMWVLGSKLSRQTDILSQYLRGNRLRCAIPCNGHVYYVVSGIPFCGGGLKMVIESWDRAGKGVPLKPWYFLLLLNQILLFFYSITDEGEG